MGYQLGSGAITAPVARGDKIVYRGKRVLVNGVDVRGMELPEYLDEERLVYRKHYREKLGAIEHDILFNDDAPSRPQRGDNRLPKECTDDGETLACTLPAASYFVMGDNRDNTVDSRFWGFVPASAVIGKVVYIALPQK